MKSIVFLCALAAAAPATALAETLASFSGENAAGKEFSLVFEADGHSFVGAQQNRLSVMVQDNGHCYLVGSPQAADELLFCPGNRQSPLGGSTFAATSKRDEEKCTAEFRCIAGCSARIPEVLVKHGNCC